MSPQKDISVVIVDDHTIVREGLNALISFESDMTVVGQAGSGSEAIALHKKFRPTVMLMDLLLPDMNGAEVIRAICSTSHNTQIVVLTSAGGDEEIHRALDAGARGYLFKDIVRQELVHAIRAVCAGRRYIPAQVSARLVEHLPRQELSAREIEVLQLVAVGLKNKEIAYQLAISEATVNAHVKRILQKLDANDRTQAVTIALRRGIIRL